MTKGKSRKTPKHIILDDKRVILRCITCKEELLNIEYNWIGHIDLNIKTYCDFCNSMRSDN